MNDKIEDLGSYLKALRERADLTIEDVADKTKLRLHFLEALEDNRLDDLPGEVYVRPFVKAYVESVGGTPADIAHAYMLYGRVEKQKPPVRIQAASPPAPKVRPIHIAAAGAVAIVVVILLLLFGRGGSEAPESEPTTPDNSLSVADSIASEPSGDTVGPLPQSETPPVASVPAAGQALNDSGVSSEGGPAGNGTTPLRIAIRGRTWVSISSGEDTVAWGLFNAGEIFEVDVDSTYTFVFGRPDSVRIIGPTGVIELPKRSRRTTYRWPFPKAE